MWSWRLVGGSDIWAKASLWRAEGKAFKAEGTQVPEPGGGTGLSVCENWEGAALTGVSGLEGPEAPVECSWRRRKKLGRVGAWSLLATIQRLDFILRTVGSQGKSLSKGVKWSDLQWLKSHSTVGRLDWKKVRLEEERPGWRDSIMWWWFVFVFGASLIWILPTFCQNQLCPRLPGACRILPVGLCEFPLCFSLASADCPSTYRPTNGHSPPGVILESLLCSAWKMHWECESQWKSLGSREEGRHYGDQEPRMVTLGGQGQSKALLLHSPALPCQFRNQKRDMFSFGVKLSPSFLSWQCWFDSRIGKQRTVSVDGYLLTLSLP